MLQITAGLALFFTAAYGSANLTPEVLAQATSTVQTSSNSIIEQTENVPLTLETYLQQYYSEDPLLVEIAKCESTFRHYDSKGRVMRGNVDAQDVGVMQINEHFHLEKAESLGFDIHTIEGNLAYAKYLYKKYGAQPWSASSPCWSKTQAYRNYVAGKTLAINK